MEDLIGFYIEAGPYNEAVAKRRMKLLTHTLSTGQKMELYNSCTKGDLNKIKNCAFNKKYSLLEECSKAGYYWSTLHYASHYGHESIILFLIDFFMSHPQREEIFNIQTTEGYHSISFTYNTLFIHI
jgi:hypothetical protein